VSAAIALLLAAGGLGGATPGLPQPAAAEPCAGAEAILPALGKALDGREWSEAERMLQTLPAPHASCGRVVLGRARLLAARGDAIEAELLFARARSLAPDDPLVHALFARYWLARGDLSRADRLSAQALSLAPESPEALLVRGQLAARKGQLHEARLALEKAAAGDPSNAEAHYQLGIWSFRLKRRAEAAERFRRAAELRPGDARALDYLALSLEALGDPEAAEHAYRTALAVNDGPFFDSLLDHNYGRFLLKRGRLEESRVHLDRAVALLAGSRAAHYERSKLNLAAGDYAAARRDAERASSLGDPEDLVLDVQVYYLLATVYARLGERELAQKYAELARATPIPGQ
jgi:tetratricopeptide (TPR) repeat protein